MSFRWPLALRSTVESKDALLADARAQLLRIADDAARLRDMIRSFEEEHVQEIRTLEQQSRDTFQALVTGSTAALAEAYQDVANVTRSLRGNGRQRVICVRCSNGVGEHNAHCVGSRIIEYATIKVREYESKLPPLHDAHAPAIEPTISGEDARAAMDENGVTPDEQAVLAEALTPESPL